MSYNLHWPRWIKASICKYFNDNKGSLNIFVEGQERKTNQLPEYIELRFDGPTSREQSKDFWHLEVKVNCLCTCNVDDDLYHISRLVGAINTLIYNGTIGVYKLGIGPDDDSNVSIGCLTLMTVTGKDNIEVHEYGQINVKTKLLQATVEAKFYIEFDQPGP